VSRGFTLVETIVVLLVIGIVLTVAVPAYVRYMDRTRVLEAISELDAMSRKIKDWELSRGALPDSLSAVVLADQTNLGEKVDPWGRGYEYFNLRSGLGNGAARQNRNAAPINSDFDLYSRGADGLTQSSLGNAASRDDIVRGRDGRFVGLAEGLDP
jgi:general secretion pathway protein G